jgi:hypothetical protein
MSKQDKVNGAPIFAVGIAYGIFIIVHDMVKHHVSAVGVGYGLFHIVAFGGMIVLERLRPVE